ncbi:ABC transporter substrate-binding protein [Methylobacterium sp. JK268]
MISRRLALLGAASAIAGFPRASVAQAKTEIVLSRQLGLLYIPTHVVEKQQLLEKHCAKLGLKGVTTRWLTFANGGAQQDGLLSGNVDIINTGTGPLLLLWDKSRGRVKGIVATSSQPIQLISRDPRITSLKDFREGDRIAVPTIRSSTQAILLQMAASRLYGNKAWNRLDPFTVQLGHADAFIALKNLGHEVRSHFSAPPYQSYELKQVPSAHLVATSSEIIGTPLSQGQFITTTAFAEANPVVVQALRNAVAEAKTFIEAETAETVAIYRAVTGDKTPPAELLGLLREPDMMAWEPQPQGTMAFAQHLARIGSVKSKVASWKDYYLPVAHDLPGS